MFYSTRTSHAGHQSHFSYHDGLTKLGARVSPNMRLFIAVHVTETVRRSEKFFNGLKKAVKIWLTSIYVMVL